VTPLQKVAMGLVIVLVDAPFSGYDGVPDPLGWVLVVLGLHELRSVLDNGRALVLLAGLCLAVSVATYPPQVSGALDDSGGWALSLPQLALGFALCTALASSAEELGGRFRLLRWVFVLLAAAPVLVLGGGVEALRGPLALVSVAANLYLVYLLFRVHGRVAGTGATTDPSPTG
jgi:hypothetical protein